MSAAEHVHLHVHSEFSMLDGAIRIDQLVGRAAQLGMRAVALTDHGNMFGALQLHKACKQAGIGAILGCEVYVTPGHRTDASDKQSYHLVLLAGSQEGYKNLIRLVSLGWVDGLVGGVPRIDLELLAEHRKGLVGLSGCMGGYASQQVLLEGPDAGRRALGRLVDCFEPESFYVELQDHGFTENRPLNGILADLARAQSLPLVATNDCHYLDRTNARAQLVLQCIGAGRTLREMEALHHGSSELYLKSADQMVELFKDFPDAVRNTLVIAERCAGRASPLSDPKLPRFQVPAGQTEESHLRELAERGLVRRFEELGERRLAFDENGYRARLALELDVIATMGFAGYFLIVQDFINWAKTHDVPVGPGRGSGAGSLVAWSTRITDLDPISNGLLFERFLNPDRVSMPDFDIDFCMDRREQVIDYVRAKYGEQSVGQIATFHQLRSRSVVRDVGRVVGMSPADAGRIAALVPEPIAGKSVPIEQALTDEPRLKQLYEQEREVAEVLDTAQELENLTRHAGMHAAGVVISEGPIWDHVPVFCPEENVYVTQFHKDDVEAAGLVKFDFLGLKTLTVIDVATKLIDKRPDRPRPWGDSAEQSRGPHEASSAERFRIELLPMDDRATYALLQSGETTNVFQLESTGMQSLFKQLRPDCFDDVVAAVALYRPGPMGAGMHDDFVQRRHGRAKVDYLDPSLEPILRDTRGVIVYQEQVMQIARVMGGYTLGGADLLRRAMGKKKAEEMAQQKETFISGAIGRGYPQRKADEVFELMAYFAGYGFNKSHSAAYALITYQTAYLKAHFPVEFVCATLTADKDKSDRVVRTVAESRAMGVTVLPPDVNESSVDFTVVYDAEAARGVKRDPQKPACWKGTLADPAGPKIRFGLGAIKGVGTAALEAIFEARRTEEGQEQPFVDLFDFCARVDLRRVNKSVVEALVQCGAFDTMHTARRIHRAQAFAAIESGIERGKRLASERSSGQTSLFGLLGGDDGAAKQTLTHPGGEFAPAEPWDSRQQLAREKATLGFYVSGHPLDRYAAELRRFGNATTETFAELDQGTEAILGGSVEGYRERRTKMGGTMAFFDLEDSLGRVEVIVRPQKLETQGIREALQSGEPVLLRGRVKFEQDRNANGSDDAAFEPKLLLEDASLLTAALAKKTREVRVRLDAKIADRDKLVLLRTALEKHPGACPVSLEIGMAGEWKVSFGRTGLAVDPSDALLASLERLFGRKVGELVG